MKRMSKFDVPAGGRSCSTSVDLGQMDLRVYRSSVFLRQKVLTQLFTPVPIAVPRSAADFACAGHDAEAHAAMQRYLSSNAPIRTIVQSAHRRVALSRVSPGRISAHRCGPAKPPASHNCGERSARPGKIMARTVSSRYLFSGDQAPLGGEPCHWQPMGR